MKKGVRVVIVIASILAGTVILASALLAWLSRALVYYPARYDGLELAAVVGVDAAISETDLDTDGVRLHGFIVRNSPNPRAPWTVFFGGQGDAAFRYVRLFRRVPACNFVLFDYRGYGLSGGEPSEKKLMEDAVVVFDHVRNTLAGSGARVYAMGFSLGTGVAVSLAADRPVDGLVLAAPYDSIRRVAADSFPEFIVTIFLHEDYDSLSRIGSVRCPVLMFATPGDRVVSFKHTQALFARAGESKTLVPVPGATHTSIMSSETCLQGLHDFLK